MKVICGYNVNIDFICRVGSWLSLPEKMGEPPEEIRSMDDFYASLINCMKNGTSQELLIEERGVVEKFSRFPGVLKMGGNAGNITNAFAELGAEFILPNVVSLPHEQAKLFSPKKCISVPVRKNHKLIFRHPSEAVRGDEKLVHFVFEFSPETIVFVGREKVVPPMENRLILTWDPPNRELKLAPDFRDASLKVAGDADAAVLTGFQLLVESYGSFKEKIGEAKELAKEWKEINEGIFLHLELADYQSDAVLKYVLKNFPWDSIGMNDDELGRCMKVFGRRMERDLDGIISSGETLMKKTGAERICIHTREFSVSLRKERNRELKALKFGSKVASDFAVNERIINIGEVEKEGVCRYHKDLTIYYFPSFLVSPRRTVGIGDVFTASTLYYLVRYGACI